MSPAEELDLVRKAILEGATVTGCCEWHTRTLRRLKSDAELCRFTPDAIRTLLIEYIVAGGIIHQVKEQRPEYDDFDYYYKVIIPLPEFSHGLFVELRITDPDNDCPTVILVNAHAQHK